MDRLDKLLSELDVILLDGAMGTMLIGQGLKPGTPPELWNVEFPGNIQSVHRAYIEAGSRIILTNSFGGNRMRLSKHNLEDRVVELNHVAAQNARREADVSDHIIAVAGSIGPTGELMRPYGKLEYEEAKAAFAEQAKALEDGGVDLLWIETMSDLNEAEAAVDGAQSVSKLPLVITMSFEAKGRTMMGVSTAQVLEVFKVKNLVAMGANCGKGPGEVETAIRSFRTEAPGVYLVAKPNAGAPKMLNAEVVYDGTPELMAEFAEKMKGEGVKFIGACCGSTPAHIRAMSKALKLYT
jgi:5-methyltetrahydrofolate--homocysteine methyltransferase